MSYKAICYTNILEKKVPKTVGSLLERHVEAQKNIKKYLLKEPTELAVGLDVWE